MIGAHPDDEDTHLITWLSRGRYVSTAYLSLTRGDGGQNVIGNELGEALGVLRTEELLAARRIDGAQQFFTRAYDFGFSKDTVDTYAHWPKAMLLGDVVRVVRAFRPHVIVAVFSGTTRDGHGQHQVSGLLAREAYEIAGDSLRYPTWSFGAPWRPLKFYRAARGNAQQGTLGVDVGEYSPLRGQSYGEIAGRSRSQHKSQGFGALERKGPIMNYVRREATRVNETTPATSERSIFDGIDTTWARMRSSAPSADAAALVDSLPAAFAAARAAYDPLQPWRLVAPLWRLRNLLNRVCYPGTVGLCEVHRVTATTHIGVRHSSVVAIPDLYSSVVTALARVDTALLLASGIAVEAHAVEEWPLATPTTAVVSIYNRGTDTVVIREGVVTGSTSPASGLHRLAPGDVFRDSLVGRVDTVTQPAWLAARRSGAMFGRAADTSAARGPASPGVSYAVDLGRSGATVRIDEPLTFRFVDDVKGDVERPVAAVPAVSITLDQQLQYARAGMPLARELRVTLRNADPSPDLVRVALRLPAGLRTDSAERRVAFSRAGETQTLTFPVRGRLAAGSHSIAAVAMAGRDTFDVGYQIIDYDHVRRRRLYRPARTAVTAIDVAVPAVLRVAYVPGVSDNVAPALQQLGIAVTVVPASEIGRTDLSRYTTVVVGPRAYDAHPELAATNPKLFDFARRGGTLVVQYGQYEMTRPGMMPYPITINRPHDRVTREEAPVTILDENAPLLRAPNRITQADFANWVQERSLYMPRTFDERYAPAIAISDPGEPLNRGGILVAPLGRGRYVYTTLAFFRQLPAGVPGAARLFVNLLSAGLPASTNP